jgi:hypothetical protein
LSTESIDGQPGVEPAMTDRVRVPDHVVYRRFAAETVILNLQTGRYHGLNATAGQILEALEGGATLAEASEALAGSFDVPREQLDADLRRFCADLAERGLVEVDGGDG